MSGKELKQVLGSSGTHLLGMYQPLGKLLALVQNESCKLQELIDTIEYDPTLVHEFIRISAAGSLSNWHHNLTIESVRAVTTALCIEKLRDETLGSAQPLIKQFWLDSVAMAVSSASIVEALDQAPGVGSSPSGSAYLTGLLSSMGQIQLLAGQGDSYEEFVRTTGSSQVAGTSEHELTEEARKFGLNRFEIAADLVGTIDKDPTLSEAIRYHHLPLESLTDSHWLVRSLALARVIAPTLTSPGRPLSEDCYRTSTTLLGFDRQGLEQIVTRATESLARIKRELGISEMRLELGQSHNLDKDLALFKESVNDASVIAVIRGYLEKQKNAADWWCVVEESARLLFGFNNCFLFVLDRQQQTLTAGDFCMEVAGFGVSVDAGHSVLALCVQESRIVSSREVTDLSVVDRQLARLAGGQELVCIPLNKESVTVAVLVCGVTAGSSPEPVVDSAPEADTLDEDSPQHEIAIDAPRAVAQEASPPVIAFETELANSKLMLLFSELVVSTCREYVSANRATEGQGFSIDPDYIQRRAREVTHEINNPLSVVQNYMKILSMKLDADSSAQADLETISQEISRISAIVEKLTELGTEDDPGMVMADVNQIIGDIVGVFRGSSPEIKFVMQLGDLVPGISQNRDTIKQILVNLLKNSKEALGESGCIVIGTSSPVYVGGEPFLEIMVSDDGPGIPQEVEARLFQEVNSNKGFGHEGIGLSIVKQLVDEMQGLITCRSRPGTGTDFQILIPIGSDEFASKVSE